MLAFKALLETDGTALRAVEEDEALAMPIFAVGPPFFTEASTRVTGANREQCAPHLLPFRYAHDELPNIRLYPQGYYDPESQTYVATTAALPEGVVEVQGQPADRVAAMGHLPVRLVGRLSSVVRSVVGDKGDVDPFGLPDAPPTIQACTYTVTGYTFVFTGDPSTDAPIDKVLDAYHYK